MAAIAHDPDAPDFVRQFVNLADAELGARALRCSDDFFAEMARMLNPQAAQFIPGKYDLNGKWMDGWESRRKRGPGHDWCVIELARPGVVYGVDLDTSHFTGNFPPAASLEGATSADGPWSALLDAVNLRGNQHHYFKLNANAAVSHVRVNLFPDGGLARLRVYGVPSFTSSGDDDLIAALNGGTVIAANNQHFGDPRNLLKPGRGADMGDGWETRRRREPGSDWCVIALAQAGVIQEIEVDTCHFKGNFPDRCSIQATPAACGTRESLITQSMFWPVLLPEQSLRADAQHFFKAEICAHSAISHIRFNIHPDGGVSRLRLRGRV